METICKLVVFVQLLSCVLLLNAEAEAEPGHPMGGQGYGAGQQPPMYPPGQMPGYGGGFPQPFGVRKCVEEMIPNNQPQMNYGKCDSRTGLCAKAYFKSQFGPVVRRFCMDTEYPYPNQQCQYKQVDFLDHGFQEAYLCVCSDRDMCNSAMLHTSKFWMVTVAIAGAAGLAFSRF